MEAFKGIPIIRYENEYGQVALRQTSHGSTDNNQHVYMLKCKYCGTVYGANGSDIW